MEIEYVSALGKQVRKCVVEGHTEELEGLLSTHDGLAKARIRRDDDRTDSLLHVATDWPGHYPNVAATVRLLASHGADVNARCTSDPTSETPLHWAASSGDVEALGALIECGADLEARGCILDGGTAISNAVNFGMLEAAHRLVAAGAQLKLGHAAALGLMENVRTCIDEAKQKEIDYGFWMACHHNHQEVAALLLERGANINQVQCWDDAGPPLNAARKNNHTKMVAWLLEHGAEETTAADEG